MDARSTAPDAADGSTTPALNSPKHGGQGSFSGEHVPGTASAHRAPGFVNRTDDLLPGMVGTANAVEERYEEESKADETVPKGGTKGNLGWAVSGLLAKTTMLTIHSARDGMLGKMTEVGVHQPVLVLDDTAEDKATQDGQSSEQGADAELGGRQEEEEDRMVMFENEEEGTVTMKDEIKVQFSAFPTPLSHSRTLGIWGA